MKTKTMGKQINRQYELLINKSLDERTDEQWELIYTYKNLMKECGGFVNTDKVVAGLQFLEFKYNKAIEWYDELSKSPYDRVRFLDDYNINLRECKETLRTKLNNRINIINYIVNCYILPNDDIKKLKLKY